MSIRDWLYRQSAGIQSFIIPELRYSQDIYGDVLRTNIDDTVDWLDLGCGHCVLPSWQHESEVELIRQCRSVIGLDFDMLSLTKHKTIDARIRGDISNLPFPDGSIDIVTANMVVEHLDDPRKQFAEVFRVLRPGGKFIFHTMNVKGYYTVCARMIPETLKDKLVLFLQEREEEDLFDTHYLANSETDISRLSNEVGFKFHRETYINSFPQFRVIPPLVFFELLWIKMLMGKRFEKLRPNLIAILTK